MKNSLYSVVLILFIVASCSESINPVDSGLENQIYHHGNGSEPQGLDPHIVTGVPEHHMDPDKRMQIHKDHKTKYSTIAIAHSQSDVTPAYLAVRTKAGKK